MSFMIFMFTIVITGLLVLGLLVGMAKLRNRITGDDALKEGERRGHLYSMVFKDIADISRFQDTPNLSKSFAIRSINNDTVVVESPLHESEIRDYMLEHLQMGPQKVVVAPVHNPAISLSSMM